MNLNRSVLIFTLGVGVLVAGAVTNVLVPQLGYMLGFVVGSTYAFILIEIHEWRRGVPKVLQGPKQCGNCGVLSPDFVAAAKHVMQTGHPSFHNYPKREVNQ